MAAAKDDDDDMPDNQASKAQYQKDALAVIYKQMDTQTAWEKDHASSVHAVNAATNKLFLDHAISQEGQNTNNWHEYENTKPNLHPEMKTY